MKIVSKKIEAVIPRMEIIDVTPALAREWLGYRHEKQRNLSAAAIDKYARDMSSGNWELTHQSVGFNRDGVLIDGHHRLSAVVKSGATVCMMVVFDLQADYTAPIDQGRGRKVGEIVGLDTRTVAIVTALHRLQTATVSFKATLSVSEVRDCYEANVDVVSSVLSICGNGGRRAVRSPIAGAVAYAWPINPEVCENFLVQVRDGEMIGRNDPAFALRNWVQSQTRQTIEVMFGSLNAVRHAMVGNKLRSIYTGSSGYRAITTKRRAMKVPNTPSFAQVESLASGNKEMTAPAEQTERDPLFEGLKS